MAFQDLLTDPIYSNFFSENDGCDNSWLQSTYSDSPFNGNDDYLVSPQDVTLDGSTYTEPEMLSMWETEDITFNPDSVFGNDSVSSINHSHPPSLCDDTDTPPPTPSTHDTPSSELEEPPKRKRGRPRLSRDDSDPSYGDPSRSHKSGVSKRQPHNQVERKYRDGLNAELERLRMAVRTLPHWDSQAMNSPPKPSKATVLASAIDYIHKIEVECDRLQRENEVLKTKRLMAIDF